jgi:hypothetical protein
MQTWQKYLTGIISGVFDCSSKVTMASKALLAYSTNALPELSDAHDTIRAVKAYL